MSPSGSDWQANNVPNFARVIDQHLSQDVCEHAYDISNFTSNHCALPYWDEQKVQASILKMTIVLLVFEKNIYDG